MKRPLAAFLLLLTALLPVVSPLRAAPEVSLPNTEEHLLHSALLQRTYPLSVSLPDGYARHPEKRYPLLLLADGPYAFPLVRSIVGRVADGGEVWREPIIVGLGYAAGEERVDSRRRDYTPTPHGDIDATPAAPGAKVIYGGAEAYSRHLEKEVLPFLARLYRIAPEDRTFAGHSYGGLLGVHILLTRPTLFSRYILLSPSLWYGYHIAPARERGRTHTQKDLPAKVYFAIGSLETTPTPSALPTSAASYDMVGDMEAFIAALRSRHYPSLQITQEIVPDEDHMTVYPVAITHALGWAYGAHSLTKPASAP